MVSIRYCGICADDRVGHAVCVVEPEIRLDLSAAGQRDEQAVRDVALTEPHLVCEGTVDRDIDLRIAVGLLDTRIGDPGHLANSFEELARVGVIGILVRSRHLQIDRRRQPEIEDLRDDVGRQEREGRAGKLSAAARSAGCLT